MHIRKLLVLVLLGLSVAAAADFRTITEAYEVALSDLRLPGSENGTLTFKQCSDCEAQILRVTGKTRYLINDRDFALAEFKKQLKRIRNRNDQNVAVLHHLESNTIKAVKVWL
jgi:hypothetical protein